jgi:hypothetical protein
VGKSVIDARCADHRDGELDAGRQGSRDDVTISAQPAMRAVMETRGEGLSDPRPAHAMLAHGGGSGAGPIQAPAGVGALTSCRFSTRPFTTGCQIVVAVANPVRGNGYLCPAAGSNFIATDVAQDDTLQGAEQEVNSDGATLKLSHCSTGSGGMTPPPPPGRVAAPILGGPGAVQAH